MLVSMVAIADGADLHHGQSLVLSRRSHLRLCVVLQSSSPFTIPSTALPSCLLLRPAACSSVMRALSSLYDSAVFACRVWRSSGYRQMIEGRLRGRRGVIVVSLAAEGVTTDIQWSLTSGYENAFCWNFERGKAGATFA